MLISSFISWKIPKKCCSHEIDLKNNCEGRSQSKLAHAFALGEERGAGKYFIMSIQFILKTFVQTHGIVDNRRQSTSSGLGKRNRWRYKLFPTKEGRYWLEQSASSLLRTADISLDCHIVGWNWDLELQQNDQICHLKEEKRYASVRIRRLSQMSVTIVASSLVKEKQKFEMKNRTRFTRT